MLLKPLDYCLVIVPEVGLEDKKSFRLWLGLLKSLNITFICKYLNCSLRFDKPAAEHGLHVSITEVLVRLQDLTLHHLLQQEAAETPVEEGSHVLPIQNILFGVES